MNLEEESSGQRGLLVASEFTPGPRTWARQLSSRQDVHSQAASTRAIDANVHFHTEFKLPQEMEAKITSSNCIMFHV